MNTEPPNQLKPLGDYEVWLVAGSIELYGESVLRRVNDNGREIAATLDASSEMPLRVVYWGAITRAESVRQATHEANNADACVGVIAWMHTFSPAKMWIDGLTGLRKPLLHFHTQFNRDLPWSEIDMEFMNLNQSAHGDREFAFLLNRLQIRRKTICGHWRDAETQRRIGTWTRACCGWREARTLSIARFGDNMRGVAVTEGDKLRGQSELGISTDGYGVGDLVSAGRAVADEDVETLVREYEERYELAPALRTHGEQRRSLYEAARIEAGLRSFLDERGAKAFTDNFEDLGDLPQVPGIAVQRLMCDGYGFGAEGDWKTAGLLRVVKVMSAGLKGGSSFMEDYTYHLAPPHPKILGAHMLEVCPSITDGAIACEIHPLSIGGKADPVRLVFTARQGEAVVASLIDLGDRFRLVVNEVDVVAPDEPLHKLPVARAVWRPKPELVTAAEAWLMAGGAHHTVLAFTVGTEALADFAEIAGIELVVIDSQTRVTEFADRLRWTQGYYATRTA